MNPTDDEVKVVVAKILDALKGAGIKPHEALAGVPIVLAGIWYMVCEGPPDAYAEAVRDSIITVWRAFKAAEGVPPA